MNKLWVCLLAATLFSGAVYAQMDGDGEDIEAEIATDVDEIFASMDADKNGKISKDEVLASVRADTDEPEDSLAFIDHYGSMLMDFLAADANDDLEVTKAELTALLRTQYAGDKAKLSKADLAIIDKEYYTKGAAALIKMMDNDGDGKISEAEGERGGGGFGDVDLNGDGFVTALEIRKSLHAQTEEAYNVPEYDFGEDEDAAEAEIPQPVKETFAQFDTDGDGKISKAEIKTGAGENENPGYWWGVYISFLAMDTDNDGFVDLNEFAVFGRNESEGVNHKLYPHDKDAALNEIWGDLDTDKDGKVSAEEFAIAFPGSDEYKQWDKDNDGDVNKDEFWNGLLPSLENYTYVDDDGETPAELTGPDRVDFEAMDADGDGGITSAELKQYIGEQNNIAVWWGTYIRFRAMDADGDKSVDAAEFAVFRDNERKGVPHKLYPADRDAVMDLIWSDLDADKDGTVTKEEFGKHFEDTTEYDQIDADGDGNITRDEFWSALLVGLGDIYTFVEEDGGTDDETDAEDEADAGEDPFGVYKKAGRSWTMKSTSKMGNMETVTYHKTEVIEVNENSCRVRYTFMDAKKNVTSTSEDTIEFDVADEDAAEEVEDETINVEAGTFDCEKSVSEDDGFVTTYWVSKEFGGLMVKSVTSNGQIESRSELVEFNS